MNRNEEIRGIVKSCLQEELPARYKELPPKVQLVVACIHKNLLDKKLTLEWLYRKCHVTRHNFSSKFKYYTGRTPKQYILHYRITVAKRLLSHPQLKNLHISEVAFEVGFPSFAAFSRIFKRRMGMSPGRWRRKNS